MFDIDIYEGEEREKVKETNRTIDALKRLDTRMRDIIDISYKTVLISQQV